MVDGGCWGGVGGGPPPSFQASALIAWRINEPRTCKQEGLRFTVDVGAVNTNRDGQQNKKETQLTQNLTTHIHKF